MPAFHGYPHRSWSCSRITPDHASDAHDPSAIDPQAPEPVRWEVQNPRSIKNGRDVRRDAHAICSRFDWGQSPEPHTAHLQRDLLQDAATQMSGILARIAGYTPGDVHRIRVSTIIALIVTNYDHWRVLHWLTPQLPHASPPIKDRRAVMRALSAWDAALAVKGFEPLTLEQRRRVLPSPKMATPVSPRPGRSRRCAQRRARRRIYTQTPAAPGP
jgi:hypothetical protein